MREIELIDKRKRREKHFLQEDGTIIAKIYSEDVHYLDNGKYEEIDNTLIEEKEYYTNRKNSYKVRFSKQTQKKLMKLENSNHYLDIKLEQEKTVSLIKEMKSNNFMDKVKYKNILDNIDLEYKVLPNKVKESIIIKEKINIPSRISFIVDTDLNLILNNDKSISAIKDGNTYFVIDAPYMVDSKGEINKNIYYELISDVNGYKLNLILDTVWLNKEDIAYPIVIDPTITNSENEINIYDTYIYPGDTGVDKNSQDILKAGVERVNGNDIVNRTLIKFDLPVIGTGSQIIDANLQLIGYPSEDSTYSQDIMEVRRITSEWNEADANWNNMNDKFDNSRIDGSFYAQRSYAIGSIIPSPVPCFVDLTDLVKKWYTDLPNNGIMIKSNNEVYKNDKFPAFFSNNNTGEISNPKPIIQITYRNQNGLESYMKYIEKTFSSGASCINVYNGNLVNVFKCESIINDKNPINLNVVYNTNDVILNNNYGYGIGFKFNFHQTIKKMEIDNKTYLEYSDEDGTLHYFSEQRNTSDDSGQVNVTEEINTYYDEDGLGFSIVDNSDYYVLKDKTGNSMKFIIIDNIGYLNEIIDINNNKITINYNSMNKITKIVDPYLSEINITYGEDIITVSTSNRNVKLYLENNKITKIINNFGQTEISYNSNNIISEIKDSRGKKLCFLYYDKTPYRIKNVMEYGYNGGLGKTLELKYKFSSTTLIENNNKVTTYTFNKYGNVTSTTNLKDSSNLDNALGKYTYYGEYCQQKNKLLTNEIPIGYVKNYLKNSSFENNDLYFEKSDGIQLEFSEEYALSGQRSLKIVNSESKSNIYETVSVPKGKFYTFSLYIKNNACSTISLSYINELGETIEEKSEIIQSNDTFNRYDVTINYPLTAVSDLILKINLEELGMAYIDDVQLEIGEVANSYNYLDSSMFSSTLSSWGVEGSLNNYEVVTLNDDINCLRVKMNPGESTSFSKSFNISGNGGDMYTVSFWFKNYGLYADGVDVGGMIYNTVTIVFDYDDEYGSGIPLSLPLQPNEDEWQFFTFNFVSARAYNGLTLKFFQIMNANDIYIANVSLYKDIKSNKVQYNQQGNISSLKRLNDTVSSFDYDVNNQLVKISNPKGDNIFYEYDKLKKGSIINSVMLGICYTDKYDNFNNPIYKKTKYIGLNDNITSGLYKIRLKGTENYLRNYKLFFKENNNSNCVWEFIKENEYYKIKSNLLNNKYLTVNNDKLIIGNFDNDTSLFELTKNNDGTYYIKSKAKPLYLKYVENSLILTPLIVGDLNFEFCLENMCTNIFIENDIEYTDNGKYISSLIDSNFNKTSYTFDDNNGMITSIKNPKDQITNYIYNDKKQLVKIEKNGNSLLLEYNNKNMLSKISSPDRTYNFEYDEFLNIKSASIGDEVCLIQNNYDSSTGNLISISYGNNDIVNINYDEFNRMIKLNKKDCSYRYIYNNNGDISKIIFGDHVKKYNYGISKRIYNYRFDNFSIDYMYDKHDNIIKKEYRLENINNKIVNEFNLNDLLIKSTFDNKNITYSYDYLGRIETKIIDDKIITKYKYISNGDRTSLLPKSISNNGDEYYYTYDKLNNITNIYNNNKIVKKYFYDEFNQLIKEDDFLTKRTIKYNYDSLGNIKFKKVYELETCNLLFVDKFEYSNSKWKDLLTKYNDKNILYDSIGNPISIGENITLIWENGHELKKYISPNNNVLYEYDENGFRISKTINGIKTLYYYDDNKLLMEKIGNTIISYIYSNIDGLIGFKLNSDIYYYIKNIQNDIIAISDELGNIVAKYIYGSYGTIDAIVDKDNNLILDKNNVAYINPFRYRSYYYDNESGLYYIKSRYYNPEWCRFISTDKLIFIDNGSRIDCNLFIYSKNNPISNIDVNGAFDIPFFDTILNTAKKCTKKVIGSINWAKDHFVIEAGVGLGFGTKGTIGVGANKNLVMGMSKGEKYTGTNTNVELSTNLLGKTRGYQYSSFHKDHGGVEGFKHSNPMAFPWQVHDCEFTTTTITTLYQTKHFVGELEAEEPGAFIGLDLGAYLVVGGYIKIGFEE